MSIAVAHLRVVEMDTLTARRAERRPVDIWLKGGLVDAKHAEAFPCPLMLYLYLLKRADFESGSIKNYQHADAARTLGQPERTIRRWYTYLKDKGYISDRRHRTSLEVQVAKYIAQSERKRDRPNLATLGEERPETATHDRPDLATRSAKGGHSLIDQTRIQTEKEKESARAPEVPTTVRRFHDLLKDRPGYNLTNVHLKKIADTYPRLDLENEALEIVEWLDGPRGKGSNCSYRFLNRWLARSYAKLPPIHRNGSQPPSSQHFEDRLLAAEEKQRRIDAEGWDDL